MDDHDRDFLTSNYQKLAAFLDLNSRFLFFLIARCVFTAPMLKDILNEGTETERKERLVLELRRRGPLAFQKLKSILVSTNQLQAASLMELGRNCIHPSLTENHSDSTKDVSPKLQVRYAKELKTGAKLYKMTSKPRGKCLIINNIDFKGLLEDRVGAELDGTGLKTVFYQLGYEVNLEYNKTASEMLQLLNDHAGDPKLQNMDSCVVIIMSHGLSGFVSGVDSEKVYFNWIFNLFDNVNCPYLKGKPKMFFFQACRGKRRDCSVLKHTLADHDTEDISQQSCRRMPARTDMLIAYASVDNYVALRDGEFGSWFCQELICTLVEEAWDTDLETMLKHVNLSVQQRMAEDGEMQSTEWTNCGFNYTLYFNPGLYGP